MTFERGALWRALLLAYLFRVIGAALLALPLAVGVGASGILDFPGGDAKLFERGGLYLLEVLTAERALLEQLLTPSVVLLMMIALAGVVPQWIVVRSLRPVASAVPSTPTLTWHAARRSLGRLALLALATWMARVVLALATLGIAMAARSFFVAAADERLPLLATCIAAPFGLLGWVCLSVLHDVAAVEITLEDAAPQRAVPSAVDAFRRRGLRLGALYAAAALASLVLIGAGAALVAQIDMERGGGWRTAVAALVHQLVIMAQLVLHAAWLWSAIGAIGLERRPEPAALR